jgi:hypothetical protein
MDRSTVTPARQRGEHANAYTLIDASSRAAHNQRIIARNKQAEANRLLNGEDWRQKLDSLSACRPVPLSSPPCRTPKRVNSQALAAYGATLNAIRGSTSLFLPKYRIYGRFKFKVSFETAHVARGRG